MTIDDGVLDPGRPGAGHAPTSSFDEARFREVLGRFPSGVTIVTAVDEGEPVGFTCQAFSSLSIDPPLVALAPGKTSATWPRIAHAGVFCVNILSESQEALCRVFAVSGADKFAGVRWTQGPNGVPLLADSVAWVTCNFLRAHDAGDHELVFGSVVDLQIDPDAVPLVFYRGGFSRLER